MTGQAKPKFEQHPPVTVEIAPSRISVQSCSRHWDRRYPVIPLEGIHLFQTRRSTFLGCRNSGERTARLCGLISLWKFVFWDFKRDVESRLPGLADEGY